MQVPVSPDGKSIPAVDIALFFSTGMAIQRSELHSWSNSYHYLATKQSDYASFVTQTSKISSCTFPSSSQLAVWIRSIKKGCRIWQLHSNSVTQNLEREGQKQTKKPREEVQLHWCISSVNCVVCLSRRWSTGLSLEWAGLSSVVRLAWFDCTLPWTSTEFSVFPHNSLPCPTAKAAFPTLCLACWTPAALFIDVIL